MTYNVFGGTFNPTLLLLLHDKTKTAETKILKLGTGIVHHKSSPTN